MKYKPSRDLPLFAKAYRTIKPSELANIVLQERNKKITPESITMWFKRHPETRKELGEWIETQVSKEGAPEQKTEALGELFTDKYGTIKIVNLQTLELAKRLLALIESDLQKSAKKGKTDVEDKQNPEVIKGEK